jgi:putative transposase
MAIGRPKSEVVLSEDERIQLSSLAGSRSLPHAIVSRAKVVLWSAEGRTNSEIADRLGLTQATVGNGGGVFWRGVFRGCMTNCTPGRPRTIEDEKIAALLKRTLSSKPKAGTHWTVRDAARASGISKSTVHRLFQAFAVQPHRTRTFKFLTIRFSSKKCVISRACT